MERAWNQLSVANLHLNEPRRIGKTSLLVAMEAAPPTGWHVVNQSFQGVATTAGLVALALSGIATHRTIRSKARDTAKRYLGAAQVQVATDEGMTFGLAFAFKEEPLKALETALCDVERSLGKDRLLLAWDEVPDMITAIADAEGDPAARQVLGVLRRLRQEGAQRAGRIRWLLTGSVGFHHVTRRLGRDDLLADLDHLELGPIERRWSEHLCERLLRGAGFDPSVEAVNSLADVSGGLPVVAHLVASQVATRRVAVLNGASIDCEDPAVEISPVLGGSRLSLARVA